MVELGNLMELELGRFDLGEVFNPASNPSSRWEDGLNSSAPTSHQTCVASVPPGGVDIHLPALSRTLSRRRNFILRLDFRFRRKKEESR